jgi:hypothetical protein
LVNDSDRVEVEAGRTVFADECCSCVPHAHKADAGEAHSSEVEYVAADEGRVGRIIGGQNRRETSTTIRRGRVGLARMVDECLSIEGEGHLPRLREDPIASEDERVLKDDQVRPHPVDSVDAKLEHNLATEAQRQNVIDAAGLLASARRRAQYNLGEPLSAMPRSRPRQERLHSGSEGLSEVARRLVATSIGR